MTATDTRLPQPVTIGRLSAMRFARVLLGGLLAAVALLASPVSNALDLPAPPGLPKPPRLPDLPRFGRIDVGRLPVPRLILPEPVVVRPPHGPAPAPVYMRVPPGHAHQWDRHCHRYRACGRPVYFVEESWYQDVYVPHRRADRHDRGYRGEWNDRGGRGYRGERGGHGRRRHDH